MQLLSVNIGKEQPIQNGKSSGKTGIYKQAQAQPVHLTALGLEGDAICDKENHGGFDQAIYVYGAPDYDWWSRELGRALDPGTFGENLTLSDLESAGYAAGDRFHIGDVVLEVTAPRIPCVTLAARMGDPQFVKRFRKAERPGLYCRVLTEGTVQAGDAVTVERTTQETVTVMEMFRSFYQPSPGQDFLRRYLLAPTPLRDREEMELKYYRQFPIETDPNPQDLQYIEQRVIEFNFATTGYYDGKRFGIFVRDENGDIYAGITGFTWGGTGKVEWLWVREDWRRKGIGKILLARVEEEASRRGCTVMTLETHSFQAPGFYLKQGYEVTGKVEDYPHGHQEIILVKRLEK